MGRAMTCLDALSGLFDVLNTAAARKQWRAGADTTTHERCLGAVHH